MGGLDLPARLLVLALAFERRHLDRAMQIDAVRNSDEDDIDVLIDQLGITSADQALEIYRTALPATAAVDARRRELVSKIVDYGRTPSVSFVVSTTRVGCI